MLWKYERIVWLFTGDNLHFSNIKLKFYWNIKLYHIDWGICIAVIIKKIYERERRERERENPKNNLDLN